MPGQRMAPGEHAGLHPEPARTGGPLLSCGTATMRAGGAGSRRPRRGPVPGRKAITALERALAVGGDGEYDARTTFREVAMHWLADLDEKVVGGRRSPATAAQYRHVLDKHVFPALGDTPLPDLTTARVDRFLRVLRAERGLLGGQAVPVGRLRGVWPRRTPGGPTCDRCATRRQSSRTDVGRRVRSP